MIRLDILTILGTSHLSVLLVWFLTLRIVTYSYSVLCHSTAGDICILVSIIMTPLHPLHPLHNLSTVPPQLYTLSSLQEAPPFLPSSLPPSLPPSPASSTIYH